MLATRSPPLPLLRDPVFLGIVAVVVAHALIRIWGTPNLYVDEDIAVLRMQTLQLAYDSINPPLYDWLLYPLQYAFGRTIVAAQVLRAALLIASAGFLYAALRPKFRQPEMAAAAIAAYGGFVIYSGWVVYQEHSHSLTFYLALAFGFWAYLRVLERGAAADFALFGIAIGIGFLSKISFAIYLAALMAAAASREHRRAFYSWKLLLSFAIAAAMFAPYLIGLIEIRAQAVANASGRVGAPVETIARNVGMLVVYSGLYALPLVPIVPLALLWRRLPLTAPAANETSAAFARLLYRIVGWGIGLTVLYLVVARSRYAPPRLLIAPWFLFPAAIFASLDARGDVPESLVRWLRNAALALIAGVIVARALLFLFATPPFCLQRCLTFADYRPLARAIAAMPGRDFVVTDQLVVGANLVRHLPASWIVQHQASAPAPARAGRCVWVMLHEYFGAPVRSRDYVFQALMDRPPRPGELPPESDITYVRAGWLTHVLPSYRPDTVFAVMPLAATHPICTRYRRPAG